MFRVKVVITFFVLLGVLTGGAYFILHGQVKSSFKQDAETSLRRSATVAQQNMRLNELALIEKARYTARNQELYSTMRLTDNEQLYEQLFAKYPEASTAEGARHVAVYDEPLKVDELRLEEAAKEAAKQANQDRDLYARSPAVPDIFMVLDQNGKAVAALGKGRKRWWRHNIAEKYPIVLKAVEDNKVQTAMWNWAWSSSDSTDLYRVAIVPIRPTRGQAARGVVVAGMVLHDGMANQAQPLLAGVLSPEAEGDALVKVPEVAYFQGDRIVASTLSSAEERELSTAAFGDQNLLEADTPDDVHNIEFGGQTYMATLRFLSGQFGLQDAPTGFMVLSPLSAVDQPVATATTNIVALGGTILLLGIILILFFLQSARKPLTELEDGLGEVLAGNKDYVFETESTDEQYVSVFQGLNLMSAYLQDKPMPDDPDSHGDWGELMADTEDANANASPGKVTGVAMPGMGKKSGKKSDQSSSSDKSSDESTDESS